MMKSKRAFCVNVHRECHDRRYDINTSAMFHGNHTGVLSLTLALNSSHYFRDRTKNVHEIFNISLEANVTGISKRIFLFWINWKHFCFLSLIFPIGFCKQGISLMGVNGVFFYFLITDADCRSKTSCAWSAHNMQWHNNQGEAKAMIRAIHWRLVLLLRTLKCLQWHLLQPKCKNLYL